MPPIFNAAKEKLEIVTLLRWSFGGQVGARGISSPFDKLRAKCRRYWGTKYIRTNSRILHKMPGS